MFILENDSMGFFFNQLSLFIHISIDRTRLTLHHGQRCQKWQINTQSNIIVMCTTDIINAFVTRKPANELNNSCLGAQSNHAEANFAAIYYVRPNGTYFSAFPGFFPSSLTPPLNRDVINLKHGTKFNWNGTQRTSLRNLETLTQQITHVPIFRTFGCTEKRLALLFIGCHNFNGTYL